MIANSSSSQHIPQRQYAEQVLMRAEYLDRSDQALLEQVLGRGITMAMIATASGRSARAVQRRVKSLTERLTDPQVLYILQNYKKWDRLTGRVAILIWVKKQTLRQAATKQGLTLHIVRLEVQKIKGILAVAKMKTKKRQ